MMRSAVSTHRRALAASGTFYTRILQESDRALLRAFHQAGVRSGAESAIASIAHQTLDAAHDVQHVLVRFTFTDVLFVGPAVLPTEYHTFDSGTVGRVRAMPRLDASAPYEAAGALAVGNYNYVVDTEGDLPDGLRHGGFWAIPCGRLHPEVISGPLGFLTVGMSFFVADGCILVLQDPRTLFPDGLIFVETAGRPRRHLLQAIWGEAGLEGARWQQDTSSASFARGLLRSAGLTPGGGAVTACAEIPSGFLCLMADDTLVRTPAFVQAGAVHPLACVEGVARVLFPAEGRWWNATRWAGGYAPFPHLNVVAPDANVLWTVDGELTEGAPRLRAVLQGSAEDLEKFWALADAQQIADESNWAQLLDLSEGQTTIANGVDFFLGTLGFAADIIAVERAESVTAEQEDAIREFLRLHTALGRRAVFTRPL